MPERIQLRRTKGWRIPPGTVNVARGPGRRWGNPFVVGVHGTQEQCVARYRLLVTGLIDVATQPSPHYADQLNTQIQARNHIHELRGLDLACWCAPGAPCHADVLLELANGAAASTAQAVPFP